MPIRWMTETSAYEFLARQTEGRLATSNRAGEPYITSLNHLLDGGRIYFHCNPTGRMLENLAENPRVCFEVSEVEKIVASEGLPCYCATRYTSVLAFGAARLLNDEGEKAAVLNRMVERFANGKSFEPILESHAATCAVVEIGVDKISGKRNVDPE
jgi:nitroimidazol reductase NimA-like FMN-containing flavoprotein (pyridoxamine 5'-phosphate oxidase superfamily)